MVTAPAPTQVQAASGFDPGARPVVRRAKSSETRGSIRTLPSLEKWEQVRPAWRTPMQHRIWSEACLCALYSGSEPAIFEIPGAIGPFVKRGLPARLELLGGIELAEPFEPLVADADTANELADMILRSGYPVRLGQPPCETPFFAAFLAQGRQRGHVLVRPTEGSPFIALDPSWQDGLAGMNSRRRSDFRRMIRRAEEVGELAFHFHTPGPDEVEELLEQAIAVEARGWKSRSGSAIADNPAQRDFFRAYAPLAVAKGILRINFLTIGGTIAAMQIAAQSDGRYWLFKIGYDEAFSRCSPGQLLMLESIERAAKARLESFEFLGKAAEWTRFWTSDERPRASVYYYPRSLAGLSAFIGDATAFAWRRLRAKLASGAVGRTGA